MINSLLPISTDGLLQVSIMGIAISSLSATIKLSKTEEDNNDPLYRLANDMIQVTFIFMLSLFTLLLLLWTPFLSYNDLLGISYLLILCGTFLLIYYWFKYMIIDFLLRMKFPQRSGSNIEKR